ncbi:MAG: 50S ribosomal protein L11 methyltransferase [Gammaproteobacteria bacterium]
MTRGESTEVLLAPRIRLYPAGSLAPQVEPGWLALAHLPHYVGEAVFGDGSHPTTRLCATMVDLLCRQRQPESVLDVGTGTGVLARIARARGAELIVATDIDLVALDCAKAHSELDEHGVSIELSAEAPDHWGARFDLVVANILEEPLHRLAPALCRALAAGGMLLLSGFTRPQTPALRVLYEGAGLTFVSESHRDEWALLMFERTA